MNFEARQYQFDTRQSAKKVLNELDQICEDNGFISVARLSKAAGIEPENSNYLYGWEDLDAAVVQPVGDKFYIRLPSPSLIAYFFEGGDYK